MRDLKTEQYLEHGQFQYRYVEKVPLKEIDIEGSAENRARLSARLDEDRVMTYALEMQSGTEFPAVVLLAPPTRPLLFLYDVATGMHRLSGAQLVAGMKEFDAYVVNELDPYRREVITRQINTIEGHGISIRDRMIQCVAINEKFPEKTLDMLAKEWSLKPDSLKAFARSEQVLKRAREVGYGLEILKLPQRTLVGLGQVKAEPVFKAAVDFVQNHKPTHPTIDAMTKELKEAVTKDEKTSLAIVDRYREEDQLKQRRNQARHARTDPGPAQKLIGECRRTNNLIIKGIEHLYLNALPDSNVETARLVLDDLVGNLKRVIAKLDEIAAFRKGKPNPGFNGIPHPGGDSSQVQPPA